MQPLSRRERQIMDALHALGSGDVEDVRQRLPDPPAYDSVRTTLRILETKGHVRHTTDGRRHIFRPAQSRTTALRAAWRNLVQTFFQGSYEDAAATLLGSADADLSEAKLEELLKQVRARKRGGRS